FGRRSLHRSRSAGSQAGVLGSALHGPIPDLIRSGSFGSVVGWARVFLRVLLRFASRRVHWIRDVLSSVRRTLPAFFSMTAFSFHLPVSLLAFVVAGAALAASEPRALTRDAA